MNPAISWAGLIAGFTIAAFVWSMPIGLALNAIAAGVIFALWPVMWIVVNALMLHNIGVRSGRFDAFRAWVIDHLPNHPAMATVRWTHGE